MLKELKGLGHRNSIQRAVKDFLAHSGVYQYELDRCQIMEHGHSVGSKLTLTIERRNTPFSEKAD
jgi:hypothetical protein